MATVGIIANPAAGKDIRRLVAQGRFIPNQEKVNVLKRVLAGLGALGVERVLMMPDAYRLGAAVADGVPQGVELQILEMVVFNEEQDSTRAADLMAQGGAGCIVTLGGDGTNRAVAKGSGSVPLVPISTGTNNVFSQPVEGTVAGLAAGVVARGLVELDSVTTVPNILEVQIGRRPPEIALVDVAISTETFVGARAIWDVRTLGEVFLARLVPGSIGLSAIGALLAPSPMDDGSGLRLRIGQGGTSPARDLCHRSRSARCDQLRARRELGTAPGRRAGGDRPSPLHRRTGRRADVQPAIRPECTGYPQP